MKRTSKINAGFTLIEIMIVMVIGSAMLLLAYNLLTTFLKDRTSGSQDIAFEGYFLDARRLALIDGKTLTLEINYATKEFGLRLYEPKLEKAGDSALKQLTEIKNFQKRNSGIEDTPTGEEAVKPQWIHPPRKIPKVLTKVFSVSGLELTGPLIFIHFYPNGTSDSLILQFGEKGDNFLYIPRYNIPPVYLSEMKFFERQRKMVTQ